MMKQFKKVLAYLLTMVLLLSCVACNTNPSDDSDTTTTSSGEAITTTESSADQSGGVTDGNVTSSGSTVSTTKGKADNTTVKTAPSSSPNTSRKKLIESGLDFKGETFTKTIVGTVSSEVTRRMEAFGREYNCTVKLVRLQWESYNNQVAARAATDDPYDICGLHPRFFMSALTANLYEPLEGYISDADWYDDSKPEEGGLDKYWCNAFGANGHLYAAATHDTSYAANPGIMYYNAKLFEEAGLDDPYELYKAGKWNWDAFEEMGYEVKNAAKGKYIIGQDFGAGHVVSTNTVTSFISVKNGKPVLNLTDSNMITAYNQAKKWFDPNTGIVGPKNYSDNATEFLNGNYYMFIADSAYGPLNLMPSVVKSAAFDYDLSNLKIVPYFVGPNGSKDAPAFGGVNGKAASKGADPRVCIAWAEFSCVFEDPMADEDPYLYTDEQKAIIQELYNAPTRKYQAYTFETVSNSSQTLINEILSVVQNGGDYAQAINARKKTIQDCIDQALDNHSLGYFSKTF